MTMTMVMVMVGRCVDDFIAQLTRKARGIFNKTCVFVVLCVCGFCVAAAAAAEGGRDWGACVCGNGVVATVCFGTYYWTRSARAHRDVMRTGYRNITSGRHCPPDVIVGKRRNMLHHLSTSLSYSLSADLQRIGLLRNTLQKLSSAQTFLLLEPGHNQNVISCKLCLN